MRLRAFEDEQARGRAPTPLDEPRPRAYVEGGPVPVVYIAGIGRSGSTILGRALGSISGFASVGEVMHLFGRGMARNERCACGAPVRSCPVWGAVVRDLEENGHCPDPAAVDAYRDRMTEGRALLSPFVPWKLPGARKRLARFQALLGMAYRSIRERTGSRVVVDSSKNPAYARILLGTPGIDLYLVHLVRDARGVAFSLEKKRQRPGTRKPSELLDRRGAALGSTLWSAANVLTESLRDQAAGYVRVRYRDFVRTPDEEVARVLASLGPVAGSSAYEDRVRHLNGGTVPLDVQHVLAGNHVRDEIGRLDLEEDLEWRQALSPQKRWLVTAIALPLLMRYGYPLRPGVADAGPSENGVGPRKRPADA